MKFPQSRCPHGIKLCQDVSRCVKMFRRASESEAHCRSCSKVGQDSPWDFPLEEAQPKDQDLCKASASVTEVQGSTLREGEERWIENGRFWQVKVSFVLAFYFPVSSYAALRQHNAKFAQYSPNWFPSPAPGPIAWEHKDGEGRECW